MITHAGSTGKEYVMIGIDGMLYYAHRLAWLYIYGVWPDNQIDHKDHNKLNNGIKNLRDVNNAGNQHNQIKARVNNKSTGLLGAYFFKRDNNYVAKIVINKKQKHLGYFDTPEEAHAAYITAKRIHHGTCTL